MYYCFSNFDFQYHSTVILPEKRKKEKKTEFHAEGNKVSVCLESRLRLCQVWSCIELKQLTVSLSGFRERDNEV